MGELKTTLDAILSRIALQIKEASAGQSTRIRTNNHVITYRENGTTATLTCEEQGEHPIRINVTEHPDKRTFVYTFPAERYREVQEYFKKAGALGVFVLRQIAGYDPKSEPVKTVSVPLPTRDPFKEMPGLLEQHILNGKR